jgi:hypothetical protein
MVLGTTALTFIFGLSKNNKSAFLGYSLENELIGLGTVTYRVATSEFKTTDFATNLFISFE